MRCIRARGLFVSLFILTPWLPGCVTNGPPGTERNEDFGISNGQVWVRGPWNEVQPSKDVDEVIDQLCPAILKLPHAQWREYGQEYCGLIYSLGEGIYYASNPSSLGQRETRGDRKRKSCYAPRHVRDVRGVPSVLADYHSHPWAFSAMSEEDRQAGRQRWIIRIQFDTTCHIQKLIPQLGSTRPGELYERRGKSWALLGYILPEDKISGRVTSVEETP